MGTTEIESFNALKNQGESVTNTSDDFRSTLKLIFSLYDDLKSNWTGAKSDEYKEKMDKVHDPILLLIDRLGTQGEAVSELAADFQRFEERV